MTDASRLGVAVAEIAGVVAKRADAFRELDAKLGDGDLGVTVTAGCAAVRERLAAEAPSSPAELLKLVGKEFGRANPSTLSGLAKAALAAAANALGGRETIGLDDWPPALEAAIAEIRRRGGAELGDKTVLDALDGSLKHVRAALAAGADGLSIRRALKEGAEEAAERIVGLPARVGRASWQGERSAGTPDPGAAVWVEVARAVEALAPD